MPVVDKDYIIRLVHEVAALFARIVKLVESREYDRALEALYAQCPVILGVEYDALTFGDAESTARMLGQRERVKTFAQLVGKEAELLELKGSGAEDRYRLALELWAEAFKMGFKPDDAAKAAVQALLAKVEVTSLGPAQQAALAKVA